MSDFLSQFTKENYDREKIKISDKDLLSDINHIEEEFNEEATKVEKEATITKAKDRTKPDLTKYNGDEQSYIRDEVSEIDPGYKKKQRIKIILLSLIGFVVLVSSVLIYNNSSHTKMPNFKNVERQAVNSWANKNNIQVIYEETFDTEVDEDIIIFQSVEPEAKIKKGSSLNMTVSLGADPDELIVLPDFTQLKAAQIEEWVNSNKMRYIQLDYQYSNEIEKDTFINFEIKDKNVNKENFLRKNKAVLTLSKGKETFEKTIPVLDFKNKTKQEVEAWRVEKEFVNKFVFEEVFDDLKMEDEVIKQGVAAGEKVAKDEIITFTISKGKAITVPNYAGSELNTFDTINTNGTNVVYKEIFTTNLAYGSFVKQSLAPGTVLNDQPDAILVVYYSLARPYIQGLVGQSEGSLPSFFYEFRGKGANITYTVHKVKDCGEKGTVIRASKNNEFVNTTDHIDVYVSDGSLVCNEPVSNDE